MSKLLRFLFFMAVLAAVGFWALTRPATVDTAAFDALTGAPEAGALVFHGAGCRGCHVAPGDDTEGPAVLAGGYQIASPYGTFISPNISPGPEGLGGWSAADLGAALITGTSPMGAHYYPALPYTAYTRMTLQDVADLWAYIQTLPVSDVPSQPHQIAFPYSIRRGLGLWKLAYMPRDWVMVNAGTPTVQRGWYLVEALAHCAECHTPRDRFGGLDKTQWLRGAPNPSGKGRIPSIHPDDLTWSAADIAYYLETGFTPDFDSAGGAMTDVVRNMARLPASDRDAIAAYLKALP
ncbi:MAG: c-type cytochrome [Sedimentitalea sp.]